MSASVIDHVQLGLSRVAKQFQESPNFLAFLTALLSVNNEIENVLQSMYMLPDVDSMSGVNLDVIGAIVGANRQVSNVVLLNYFGFTDTGSGAYVTPFGEQGIPNIGARFYEENEQYLSTTILQDPEYRMLIKAKIVKNSSSSTNEDIITAISYLFGINDVKITDNLNMSISISIGRPLYATEQAMLTAMDILPRPAGVRIAGAVASYTPVDPAYTGGDPPYGDQ